MLRIRPFKKFKTILTRGPSRRSDRNMVIFLSIYCLLVLVIFTYRNHNKCPREELQTARTVINPPPISEDEKYEILDHFLVDDTVPSDPTALGKTLSMIVQRQIRELQEKANCSQPNFICGYYPDQDCDVGCQIHHRVACIMMSYVLNFPLIHDDVTGWPYSRKWSHAFLPIGSRCSPGPNTYTWTWKPQIQLKSTPNANANANANAKKQCQNDDYDNDNYGNNLILVSPSGIILDEIRYPLTHGIMVEEELGSSVEKMTMSKTLKPFMWWVAQFTKHVMRLNPKFQKVLKKYKNEIRFGNPAPIVGAYMSTSIRRADEGGSESEIPPHEIQEYMFHAEEFVSKVSTSAHTKDHKRKLRIERNLFLASDKDNAKVLKATREKFERMFLKFLKYPMWNIRGFPSNNHALKAQDEDEYEGIVRDLGILSECDYVICRLSSNVCRLLLEISHFKKTKPDADGYLKSLNGDGEYSFVLKYHTIKKMFVWKVKSVFEST